MKRNVIALLMVLVLALSACSNGTPPSKTSTIPPTDASTPSSNGTVDVPEDTREWWQTVDAGWTESTVALDTKINMTYVTCGPEDGTPIVLIHGATGSRISWSQIAPALAEKGYRVYVPELRGHGKTDKPDPTDGTYLIEDYATDIVSFFEKVGIESADVVGHSLGSLIAQRLAANIPDKIHTITLVASGARCNENGSQIWLRDGDGAFLGVYGYEDTQAFPADFLAGFGSCTNEDPDFRQGILKHVQQLPYRVWKYLNKGILLYNNTEGLKDIVCPVQIIWGTEDTVFLEQDQKELQDGLVNAKKVNFVSMEGATHNTHWDSTENAAKITSLIIEFTAD